MNCTETRSLFSLYLDGAVTGRQMSDIGEHLQACSACTSHYSLMKKTQQTVASLGRRQPPPDLALRIRVALSHEVARQNRPFYAGMLVRIDNAFRGIMVPATAGALSAIIFFALLIGFFAMPPNVSAAKTSDIPTMLYTPPELRSSPFGWQVSAMSANSVVVDVLVDPNGRIQDYRIISAPSDSDELTRLKSMLIFTQFRPATSFGQPVSGRAVLSFSSIDVKG